nr:ABC transporter permease [Chloroflexota bacterium]
MTARLASGLLRSRVGLAGVVMSAGVVLLGLLGGAVAPADPFVPAGGALRPPGAGHLFGTDDLGRDVLSGVLHGARISLLVGVVTAATAAVLGTAIGATAGFYGGGTDDLLMRLTEFVQVIPRFFLAVLVAALFGPSIVFLVLLFGLTFWPGTARLVRSQVLSLREREYVVAARALGLRDGRILVRHILPN